MGFTRGRAAAGVAAVLRPYDCKPEISQIRDANRPFGVFSIILRLPAYVSRSGIFGSLCKQASYQATYDSSRRPITCRFISGETCHFLGEVWALRKIFVAIFDFVPF